MKGVESPSYSLECKSPYDVSHRTNEPGDKFPIIKKAVRFESKRRAILFWKPGETAPASSSALALAADAAVDGELRPVEVGDKASSEAESFKTTGRIDGSSNAWIESREISVNERG